MVKKNFEKKTKFQVLFQSPIYAFFDCCIGVKTQCTKKRTSISKSGFGSEEKQK